MKIMSRIVQTMGLEADYAYDLKTGLAIINRETESGRSAGSGYDLVLLDVNLPDGNGLEIIGDILTRPLPPQIIIMTAYSDPDGAGLAIENGVWDYIQKPASTKDMRLHITRALQYQDQKKKAEGRIRFKADYILGESRAMDQCLGRAAQGARSEANVLITGETGTGKELFAKAIHENSARKDKNFIVVDCSILTENFIESVLFGHEKGAFTGAEKNRKGLVALAHGGTLFLDEVGELPESIQSSFLRVLQEHRFRPVGSEQEMSSDFRVICATNKDLEHMAREKRFRSDLLFRLNSFTLTLPPLRKRKGDVAVIAEYQLVRSCLKVKTEPKEMSPDFIEVLETYDWPGNVRELVNAVDMAVASAGNEPVIFGFHLPQGIRAKIKRASLKNECSGSGHQRVSGGPVNPPLEYKAFMERMEKEYLESLYEKTRGDIQQIMEISGISRAVLYRKLKMHGFK